MRLEGVEIRKILLLAGGLASLHAIFLLLPLDPGVNAILFLANLVALVGGAIHARSLPKRGLYAYVSGYVALEAIVAGVCGEPLLFFLIGLLYVGLFSRPKLLGFLGAFTFSVLFVSPYWFQTTLLLSLLYAVGVHVYERRENRFLFASFVVGFLLLFSIVFPLLYLMLQSQPQTLLVRLKESPFLEALLNSFGTATATTLIVLLFGVPLAYAMVRLEFRGKEVIDSLIDLPILIPQSVAGIALLVLLGPKTPVGEFLEERFGISIAGSHLGIIACQLFVSSPFLVRSAMNGFERVSVQIENVSRTLGASPLSTFFRVSLPLASRAIFYGAILTWARAISEAGSLMVLAYHPFTISIYTFDVFVQYGLQEAQPIAVLLVIICLWSFIVLRWLKRTPLGLMRRFRGRQLLKPFLTPEVQTASRPFVASTPMPPGATSRPSAEPMVKLRGVSQRFGDFSLGPLSLDIFKGEYFFILGPCGAGKTVLLETIAGLHIPKEGTVWLDGREVTYVPPEKRGIGFVYQTYHLFPHLSVWENVAYGLRYRKLKPEEIEGRIRTVAQILGIEDLLHRPSPEGLSGGESQKVALARALAIKPKLLLLDEPLHSLDYYSRQGVMETLKRINRELGVTMIHVTHDYTEAATLADRVAVMREGRIVQVGTPEEVFRRPKDKFVAEFLGVENLLEAVCCGPEDGRAVLEVGGLRLRAEEICPSRGRVHLCIRPEEVLLSKRPLEGGNVFKARVSELLDQVFSVRATLLTNGIRLVAMIPRATFLALGVSVGDEVYIRLPESSIHILEG